MLHCQSAGVLRLGTGDCCKHLTALTLSVSCRVTGMRRLPSAPTCANSILQYVNCCLHAQPAALLGPNLAGGSSGPGCCTLQDVFKTMDQIKEAGGKITKEAGALPGLGASPV